IRISRRISFGSSDDVNVSTKKSLAAMLRSPFGPTTLNSASRASRHEGKSPLGSACAAAPPVVLANVVKVADPADVDQERRRREPELHQRDQAVTAGQDFCLLAMLDQLRHRLRQRSRGDVVERGWNHRFVPPLRCIMCQIFSGVAGMSTSLTPKGDRASTTALITATLDAIVPASPIPLTPSGLVGLGVTVAAVSKDGRSGAVGIM